MEEINENVLRCFELVYPDLAKRAISLRPYGFSEIEVVTEDGSVYIYSHRNDTVRQVRDPSVYYVDFSESKWREEFAKRLNDLIRTRNITQRTLARRTGISITTINKYSNALSTPSAYNLKIIANALGCSTTELIDI